MCDEIARDLLGDSIHHGRDDGHAAVDDAAGGRSRTTESTRDGPVDRDERSDAGYLDGALAVGRGGELHVVEERVLVSLRIYMVDDARH